MRSSAGCLAALLFLITLAADTGATDTIEIQAAPADSSGSVVPTPSPPEDSRVDETQDQNPSRLQFWLLVALAICILVFALPLIGLSVTSSGRRELIKLFYLSRSVLGVEIGVRGWMRLALIYSIPASAAAFTKGLDKDRVFHWDTFLLVLVAITVAGVISNVISNSTTLGRIFGPVAGRVWSADRKVATAALLKKLNGAVARRGVPLEDVKEMLKTLLDVIVLHVRDHRGRHNAGTADVFANVLLADADKLVVVARDSMQHTTQYVRAIPAYYSRSQLLCGRAMDVKHPLTVGELASEYPEGPKNKPYRSVFAVPLISTTDNCTAWGALSIDSSQPYCFETFTPGAVENALENSLQPYLQVLILILEELVSRDPAAVIAAFKRSWEGHAN